MVDGATMLGTNAIPEISATFPFPSPTSPWQTAQFTWKSFRPSASDRSSTATGFRTPASESIVCGICEYETSHDATVTPVTGTEPCGIPRDAMVESADVCCQ